MRVSKKTLPVGGILIQGGHVKSAAAILFTLLVLTQCRYRETGIFQFSFEKETAITTARAALKDFTRVNRSENLANYQMNDPRLSSLYARTPAGNTEKVVLVCFPGRTRRDSWAHAHLAVSAGGKYRVLSVGFRVQKFDEMVKEIQDPSRNDLWGGGL